MTVRIPLRAQTIQDVCSCNGVSVQRYAGHDPRELPKEFTKEWWDHLGSMTAMPIYEMVSIFDGRGHKIDMDAAGFSVICEKWILAGGTTDATVIQEGGGLGLDALLEGIRQVLFHELDELAEFGSAMDGIKKLFDGLRGTP